ncbi:MAG: P-loop NTPase [Balneolales bacterium]
MKNKSETKHPFIFATISGKGGVGKSVASVNIADTLRLLGYRVAIIDADPGLSNCATLLNEQVDHTVMQWVQNNCDMEDLLLDCGGLTLITGSDEPGLTGQEIELLMEAMDQILVSLDSKFDIIVIDTPAGSGDLCLWALDRARLGMMILVDEPTAITDIYRLCKYILGIDPTYPLASIINFAENESNAENIQQRFNTILHYFMKQEVKYLGFLPSSSEIRESVQKQTPVTRLHPKSLLIRELEYIAHNMLNNAPEIPLQQDHPTESTNVKSQ